MVYKWQVSSTHDSLCRMSLTCRQPMVAIQNALLPEQVPVGMSVVVFAQTFGGALFLTFAQTIFNHGLVDGLAKYAPNIDPVTVTTAGANGIRKVLSPEDVPGVVEAYNSAINHDFYLAASASACAFVFAFGIGWRNIKKKKPTVPESKVEV